MKKKLLLFLAVFLCAGLGSSLFAQQKISLQRALAEIEKTYGTKFSYRANLINDVQVSLQLPLSTAEPVENVLKKILYPNKFLFLYVQKNYYTLVKDTRKENESSPAVNQDIPEPNYRVITGRVTDAAGMPLVSATVFPEGMGIRNGVITSSDGSYTLRLLQEATALVVTYVGMQPKKVELGKSNVLNIVMEDKLNLLKEVDVVSTGYTRLPKERATGAFEKITSQQIKEVPSVNILEKIENVTPGIQVDLRKNTIRIRGANSLNSQNASPLIVIDGFPVMENVERYGNLSDAITGQSGGPILNRFNPEDIESITVLKDAAAASIWGAKSGNGVIVIETKRGKSGPAVINFSTNLSISAPADLKKLKVMSSAQYIDFEREIKNLGFLTDPAIKQSWQTFNSNLPLGEALEWMFKVDRGTATAAERDANLARLSQIDNRSQIRDLLLQNAVSQQYNLSLSGGSNKNTYYISGNYTNDVPVFRGNRARSAFLTSNLTNKLFNDRLTLNLGINYTYSNFSNNPTAINSISTGTFGLRPYELLRDEAGNNIARSIRFRDEVTQDFVNKGYLPWTYSPLDDLNAIDNQTSTNRFRFNLDANTKIMEGISFSVLGSLQRNIESTENISTIDAYAVRDAVNYGTTLVAGRRVYGYPFGGRLGLINYNGWEYTLRGQFNIDKSLSSFAKLNLIAGTEIRQNRYQSSTQERYGFNPDTYTSAIVNPTVQYTGVEGFPLTIGYGDILAKNVNRALSYYSNAGISFLNDKYVVSGSVRFDDYTLTGAKRNERGKPLWSTGVKWNVKQESFMKDVNWLDALAFRLTYGKLGTLPQAAISVARVNFSVDNLINEQTVTISSPANPRISWEKVGTLNVGTDFSLLKGRLSISADFYQKKSSDILWSLPYNPTYGWSTLFFNAASMKSNGYDLGLRMDIFKNKNYSWSSILNISYNTNEVTDSRFTKNTTVNLVNGGAYTVGLPLDYMYAYRWAGLDNKGQSQIFNKNNEVISSTVGNNVLGADDLVYMGRTTAPYFGAFNNDFRYKQFNLGIRISYAMGNVVRRPSVDNYPDYQGYRGVIGAQEDLAKRWVNPGDEAFTNVPGLKNISFNSLQRYKNSDLLTISGSYIRLQQISIGYSAPSNLLKGTPFKSVNLNASVRNLGLLWTKNKDGVDPSYLVTNNYNNLPPVKTFFISLNTSF